MNRGFAHSEILGSLPYSGIVGNNIIGDGHSSIFNIFFQRKPPDLTVFTIWIFYVLTFIGVIKLRKDRPELQRPYKVPLYPIIPAIAIIGGLFVIINQLLTATLIALGGIIITLIGIPVYSITSKK